MALLPEKKRLSNLEELVLSMPGEIRQWVRGLIEEMIDRKERQFSQYRRVILDFELVDVGNGWHIEVASSPQSV